MLAKRVKEKKQKITKIKVMFDYSFCSLFSKTCFWEYNKKKILVFLKSKTCLVS